MRILKPLFLALCLLACSACTSTMRPVLAQDAQPAAKPVTGTVQSINGKTLTIKTDAGAMVQVTVADGARLLQIEPGQKTLQGAKPLNLPDLQVGDRVLARGAPNADGTQVTAAILIAIKHADIAQMQEQEREAWEKNGVGGLVKSVDPAAGTVTISLPGKRMLTIQTTKSTITRRYAPGSIQFDDAKPAPLSEIKLGDQLRARGAKSADGQTFTADEMVSGTFLNIAGPIVSINPGASTLTIHDLATKHLVVVAVTPTTEMKKLDPMVAQRIALRLRGGAGAGAGAAGGGEHAGGNHAGGAGGAAPDPQQILSRAPSVTLKDFSKGDVVMLVATAPPGPVSAVTVVGGVEPMLQASASESQAMLSSWNLGGGGGGGGGGGDAGGGGGGQP